MAPSHVYPAAAVDAISAVDFVFKSSSSLGADPDRIAIGGNSAGGNLSAVALHHCALSNYPLCYAALYIPELHINCDGAFHYSFQQSGSLAALPQEIMVWFWK